ncbi:MAG: response regulator [Planctomycetes bacterium]|nr:response regulator [Planctomycetota bacterium]
MANILLVEDDKNQQILFAEELRLDGHQVAVVGSGPEAIQAVQSQPPDLVVLDVAMPQMDGIEALGRILAENSRIPVILHTAYGTYRESFMAWAADAYVIKSSDQSELRAEVRRVLANRAKAKNP